MKHQVNLCVVALCLLILGSGCQSLSNSKNKISSILGLDSDGPKEPEISADELLDPLGARDGDRLLLDDLAPSQIATTLKTRFSNGLSKGAEQATAYYERGEGIYRQGISQFEANPEANLHQAKFLEAANQFRLAGAAWPDSSVEEDALYFQGESYFFADHYVQSNRAFEKLVNDYAGTKHMNLAEHRRYAIALYWLQLSETDSAISFNNPKRPKAGIAKEARRVLHQIRMDDPTGRLADDASMSLAKAFIKADLHYEAADTLEDLRRNYPGSEYQFDAHLLELESQLEIYQGPSYDDQPLVKADEILKSIVRTFPNESKNEIAYLEKQAARVQNMIGERDLAIAEYFERRGENLAARFHYQKIHEKFAGSSIAEQVEERMAAIEKLPPRPEQHAKWLVDLFPDPGKSKVIVAGHNEPASETKK